jgi:exodeoxyribonuclease-3
MVIKRLNIQLILFGVLVIFNVANAQNSNDESLKVIAHNIWNGFDWGKDKERRDKYVNWVKLQNPDVMALQELCGYTQEKLLEDAKKWGHNYAEILKTDGYPVGITSKKPITVKERVLENMHHGFMHCETYGIDFFIIHFSPFSHKKRHEEAKTILDRLSNLPSDQNKYMVLGDFNAVSPFDAHFYKDNIGIIESMKASEEKHAHVRNLFYGGLEYGVLAKLLGYPLKDIVQEHTSNLEDRYSSPTEIFKPEKNNQNIPERAKRIDYILTSPYLASKCIAAKVLNKEPTYYLSDHYPVLAIFDLK